MSEMNYSSLSTEELKELLTLKKNEASDYKNEEQAVKLTLNSIYGACGNSYFAFFNTEVAEAVTLQGQDLIKFAEKILNKYFQEHWHLDTELHEQLGVRNVKKISRDVILYIDTDSGPYDMLINIQTPENTFKKIKIGDFFEKLSQSHQIIFDYRGNEIIENPAERILNFKEALLFSVIKKLIRHKVTKSKWKIITESGNSVIVTGDHSITVFRENRKITTKPPEINLNTDKVLEISKIDDNIQNQERQDPNNLYNYQFSKIQSVEQIGEFQDEYVYDVEIDELAYDEQTFFANDILVHNSNYVDLGCVLNSCEFDGDPLEMLLKLDKIRLKDYLRTCFEIYAKKFNTSNYQDFELETISRNGIFLGKKKYVLNLTWESPGINIADLARIKSIGVEIIQGGTAPFAREKLTMLLKHIFSKGRSFDLREFVKMLRQIKDDFKLQKPENISIGIAINNLEKYILNDNDKFEYAKGCPMHVRAAGYHNYVLNNSKYKAKYSLIRTSEKIKYYYVKIKHESENNVFGYLNGAYPYEFAPPIDFEEQFNRVILDPINRFIVAMGFQPLSPNLLLIRSLI